MVLFDTSAIPDADIVSGAVVSLSVTTLNGDLGSQSLTVTPGTTASSTGISVGDYATNTSATAYASVDITGMSTSAYTDFTLDAAGIASVSKTGVTKFAVKISGDTGNSEPAGLTNGQKAGVEFASADTTGTSSDPKLVVTHAPLTFTANGTLTKSATTASGSSTYVAGNNPKAMLLLGVA